MLNLYDVLFVYCSGFGVHDSTLRGSDNPFAFVKVKA